MSISSMTNAALHRRPDYGPLNTAPVGLEGVAMATAPPPSAARAGGKHPAASAPAGGAISSAIQVITAYIPTEILTLYVAARGVVSQQRAEWLAFGSFLVATPLVVWLVFAAKLRADQKPLPIAYAQWPVWEMSAATVGYLAWAFALPDAPFEVFSWYSPGVAGLVVIAISAVLGLLAPLFQRPLRP